MGRSAALGGGGDVALPANAPRVLYRSPAASRSRRGHAGRILGWFLLALLVIATGVAGGLYLYARESLSAISTHTQAGKDLVKTKEIAAIASPSQPAIALIAGYDHRAGTGTNSYAGSNSDTLMLMRADPVHDTLSLLSFPRDLWVNIYCQGDSVATQNRINAAWGICGANGGPSAVVDTMEHLTGLKINYLITLDFHAFKQIVDKLHGVYMNVDQRYYNPLGTGWSAINLHPGYQKLDGGQALQYVRFRHLDSDIYRTARQQLFVEALKSRLHSELSITNLPLLTQLVGALKGNLEVIKAGGGGLDFGEVQRYLNLVYHLPPGHLYRDAIPLTSLANTVIGGADVLTTTQSTIDQTVHQFLNPPVADYGTRSHKGKSKKLPAKDVSVLVLNAGTIAGEAANTTVLLHKDGYATRTLPPSIVANAPTVKKSTIVYYDPVQPHAEDAAKQLRPLFGPSAVVAPMGSTIASFAQQAQNPLTVVAIGRNFDGKLNVPHVTKIATGGTPQVTYGLPVVQSALLRAPGPHFHVMAPHRVALYSQLSQNEGVRVFKPLVNQRELVMTFNIGGGVEYWQIEETSWNSAPILENPSYGFTYHGEHFDVYTTGGQIQMVALRTNQASYMVVNTLLNQLSNSTMLSIAKSLQPLRR